MAQAEAHGYLTSLAQLQGGGTGGLHMVAGVDIDVVEDVLGLFLAVLRPVSYPHLDVYKRQVSDLASSSGIYSPLPV